MEKQKRRWYRAAHPETSMGHVKLVAVCLHCLLALVQFCQWVADSERWALGMISPFTISLRQFC